MRVLSVILIMLGVLFGLLGVRACWHDFQYKNNSVVAAATVVSIDVKPIRSALSSINYQLSYTRDGKPDTLQHRITKHHTVYDPLPSLNELQSATWYIRYVPVINRNNTALANQLYVTETNRYPGTYGSSFFIRMLTFILISYIIQKFFSKKS